jgi:hypothetical protein
MIISVVMPVGTAMPNSGHLIIMSAIRGPPAASLLAAGRLAGCVPIHVRAISKFVEVPRPG